MGEIIGTIILGIFAVVGLVELIRWVSLKVLSPDRKRPMVLAVPLYGHEEDVEFLVRAAAQRIKWNAVGAVELYCVDCGMDLSSAHLCQVICREYPFCKMVSKDEFQKIFSSIDLQTVE